MNILIVEYDAVTGEFLRKFIKNINKNVKVIITDNEHEAISILMCRNINTFILDKKIKKGSVYSLAQKIRNFKKYKLTPIVFTVIDYKELEVYRNIHPFSYIFKPFKKEKVIEVLAPIIKDCNILNNKIKIKFNRCTLLLNIDEIIYIESKFSDLIIKNFNIKKQKIKNYSLKKLEEGILEKGFIKCHRKYIINKKYVKSISLKQNKIILYESDKEIPIGITYRKRLKDGAWRTNTSICIYTFQNRLLPISKGVKGF